MSKEEGGDWRDGAECLDYDPELFFPIGNTGPAWLQIEEAKQVCRKCNVREQCLAWALEAGQDHGVWGGMSEDERRALKRRNARGRVSSVLDDRRQGQITVHLPVVEVEAVPESNPLFLPVPEVDSTPE